jgi:hypothetical protein
MAARAIPTGPAGRSSARRGRETGGLPVFGGPLCRTETGPEGAGTPASARMTAGPLAPAAPPLAAPPLAAPPEPAAAGLPEDIRQPRPGRRWLPGPTTCGEPGRSDRPPGESGWAALAVRLARRPPSHLTPSPRSRSHMTRTPLQESMAARPRRPMPPGYASATELSGDVTQRGQPGSADTLCYRCCICDQGVPRTG